LRGLIFNIEEFAVHDGPGIRELVFFKGCPLHCTWCHNPEGISFSKELIVSRSLCTNCGRCREVCSGSHCTVCGKCTEVCPLNLRKICGREYEAKELADVLLKGKEILTAGGGGITISGGEPLAQPDFLFDLMECLKPCHIAVETSGQAPSPVFREMVRLADLVLMDIKHTDTEIHRKYTGTGNDQILENLGFLCRSEKDFIIRIPLIPGVNDSFANLEQTALMIRNARHLRGVELLPYHQTSGAKYPMTGREFNPGFDTAAKINIQKDVFEKYNIKVTIL
jgi:pyruvate formate lyase activating enzyme